MMDCLHAMAPSNEDIMRYAMDGEPLPAWTEAHLRGCKSCQQRLAEYQETNTLLLKRLYRSVCPGVTLLSHYCAGMLSDKATKKIACHVQECPLCAQEVAATRTTLAEIEEDDTFSPRIMARRMLASHVPPHRQRAMRNDASAFAWPLQYRADEINISLHLTHATNGETMLLGLITSMNLNESIEAFKGINAGLYHTAYESTLIDTAKAHDVELFTFADSIHGSGIEDDDKREMDLFATAQVDHLGNIVFKAVPRGLYMLIIYLPASELVIEGLYIERS